VKTLLTRFALASGLGLVGATTADAQYPVPTGPSAPYQTPAGSFAPYQTPGNYPRGSMTPAPPPLSPYLNLFRGANPAVNFYYGVRPWQQYGTTGQWNAGPVPGPRAVQPAFLPPTPPGGLREAVPAGFDYATAPKETTLSPAGHPVQFANTGGYFPGLAAPKPGGSTRPATTPAKKP
jgi:hypothetical protein